MSWWSLSLIVWSGVWLSSAPVLSVVCPVKQAAVSPLLERSPSVTNVARLDQIARSITVKVNAGQSGGSGIVIRRQGQIYTVVTNRHVVTAGVVYKVQTSEGRSHPATWLKTINFHGNDLALLQFRSRQTYAIATLGQSASLTPGDPVLSAGFPLEPPDGKPPGFLATTGAISLIPEKPFVGGYRLGYTNRVYQGMSGGPVLNQQGAVVGINSLHAYPLWGNPYIFQDGSQPLPQEHSRMVQSSWAVPIDTLLCLTALPKAVPPRKAYPSTACANR